MCNLLYIERMKYIIKTIPIKLLVQWIDNDNIDLKPYYQRNDVWTRKDQEALIDSILKGYPLPNFFIYKRTEKQSEMVDGQQRARTIHRFCKNKITNSQGKFFENIDSDSFLNYELCIGEIGDVSDDREIEEFYVLVNKKGKHLTTPEIHKAEFASTNYLSLVEDLLQYQNLMNLNLFTDASSKRMVDRNFIEELVAYLLHGIQDKKEVIEQIYKDDISKEKAEELSKLFKRIIDRIGFMNEIIPIAKTRYKQRNDFYTLFNFANENIGESNDLLRHQYNILVRIGPYISPSLVGCLPMRDYALNCVSQTNSKKARQSRLDFFNRLLLNKEKDVSKNEVIADIANFFDSLNIFKVDMIDISGFYLLDIK